ncbi:MAG: bacteriohopanetetrol glucosamine biosynthesis glycosyltransferase HpnI [Acidobacteria bacterium]|nr:bacteriohopanetetrol glucosamine biosynthesis glycosyltransferase HpnI [Acidobacteriota bacterium]
MHIHPIKVPEAISAFAALCGIIYNLGCLLAAARFTRRRRAGLSKPAAGRPSPPISILKPLRGMDPEMYESLRSHCLLEYPEYEILFAVHDPQDPALVIAERLQAEFPQRNVRVLTFPKILGTNIKVSNLAQMVPLAKYDYLLVNDSDIRVGADYLRRIMAALVDSKVGLVTCLYRGVAERTITSRLEALGVSTDFGAGVLMAQALEGEIRFGLGSTLALRKSDLERVGGFEALLDYLADDYELGARMAQSGRQVELAGTIVETMLPGYCWREFVRHQLRWARAIRASRPRGYLTLGLTFAIPWAVLAVAFAGGAVWAWTLLVSALVARLGMAFVVGECVLGDRQVRTFCWLIPLRDFVALGLWAAAYAGRTVVWRGERYLLRKGRLVRAVPPRPSAAA